MVVTRSFPLPSPSKPVTDLSTLLTSAHLCSLPLSERSLSFRRRSPLAARLSRLNFPFCNTYCQRQNRQLQPLFSHMATPHSNFPLRLVTINTSQLKCAG